MYTPLLNVENLNVEFRNHAGKSIHAVRDVSFSLGQERLGIVGESGSGKSTVGRSILSLIPTSAKIKANKIALNGVDLLKLSELEMRQFRGNKISMIMQDPKHALNPVMRVGDQIAEAFRLHNRIGRAKAKQKVLDILNDVQIRDPERVFRAYPHELSGGMGQRVMIAMMLIPGPDLLIADEPTSALDVTVQMQILAIIDDLVRDKGMGLIFISHDLNLMASFCDRILIMYAGRIVEECRASELSQAKHPYTKGLLACLPTVENSDQKLTTLNRDPAWLE
ncbi:MAG: ABC transporter ATP-binding protein [Candidatus Marinimicrobia bacterium]|jgi:peptide/nickel transport system ATP-binding protein|nr:ABC transporter ATP-binding protein [Deltaproteobacteria bacterium]MBT7973002.1 ABC transporter ATP-binding protein [Candidatus Neomarinimicrobiota bacterium]